jgi:xylitol oxidase
MTPYHQNWSGQASFHASRFHEPQTVDELADVVRKARKVRVIGSRHCFNDIADTSDDMISLSQMDHNLVIDRERHQATVSAGITYRELSPQLHAAGYALHNLASLDHITVIGACMSATHGSGDGNGNLATAVSGLEMVAADGNLVTLTRDEDGGRFPGAVVALGALGVVTRVTLDLVPTFDVQQHVYAKLPSAELYEAFDAIMGAGYSVSLFPTWQEDHVDSLWVKQRIESDDTLLEVPEMFHGATLTPEGGVEDPPDRYLTEMRTVGPWHERLKHFDFKDALLEGDELQTEYFVARRHAVPALRAVERLREQLKPILWLSEVRTVAADDLWLSTAYGQDVVAIHFNWHKDWPGVNAFLPVLEDALSSFEPRPHWGKLFRTPAAQVQAAYPRLTEFRSLANALDPEGKFRNDYVEKYVFEEG